MSKKVNMKNMTMFGQPIILLHCENKIEVDEEKIELDNKLLGTVLEVNDKLVIWFNNKQKVTAGILVHEVWHLFFKILDSIDISGDKYEALELCKEMYAYSFEELFETVETYLRNWEGL